MTYVGCNLSVNAKLHGAAFLSYAGCAILHGMAARPNYLAAWRKFRHLTQSQVIDRLRAFEDPQMPATEASLSRLENNKQPYSQRILEALAEIYQTDAGHLLTHNPTKAGTVLDLLARLPQSDREQAEAMLEAMAKVAEQRAGYRAG